MKAESAQSRVYLITTLLMLSVIFLVFFSLETYFQSQIRAIKTVEKETLTYMERHITEEFYSIISDLRFLANSWYIPTILDDTDEGKYYREKVSQEYANLAKARRIYDQIRLIDSKGKERIRINYDGYKSSVVPVDVLQNKSGRYYFQKSILLPPGNVYISPLDLNIENGEIEIPVKPMIRFALPIFNKEEKTSGILIFNYLGADLLSTLSSIAHLAGSELYLANSDGLWIMGPDATRDWSFMYPEDSLYRMEETIPKSNFPPDLLKGQFIHNGILFTFRKVQPSPFSDDFWYVFSGKEVAGILASRRMAFLISAVLLMLLATLTFLVLYTMKKTTDEKQRIQGMLEETVQEKASFLAHMSLEIRNPMNVVVGINRLLMDSELNGTQRDLVERGAKASADLVGIINNILNFSKIEANKITLESVSFDLPLLLEDIIEQYDTNLKGKPVSLILDSDVKSPFFLMGDPLRLKQVLSNLLSNAIKFTDIGKVMLHSRTILLEGNQVLLNISVSDTGIGIHPDDLNSIFNKFSQAEGSTSRLYGGTGLGLNISRNLVELMGGTLQLTSIPGEGSIFSFELTFPVSAPKNSMESSEEEILFNKGLNLLVVDDSEMNQFVAREILEKEGIIITQAMNGFEAVSLVSAKSFNLVLMDLQMPGMNGYEAAEKIKLLDPELPIVALTGELGIAEEMEKGTPFVDYVIKPFNTRPLLETITERRRLKTLDSERGLKRLNGDIKLYQKLLGLFQRELKKLNEMLLSMEPSPANREILEKTLHKMKSSGLGLGAEEFFFFVGKLELFLRAEGKIDNEPGILIEICERLSQEIERMLEYEKYKP